MFCIVLFLFFFFNDTATTEIYTLSLHDALPISPTPTGILARPISFLGKRSLSDSSSRTRRAIAPGSNSLLERSEEHTSELQSPCNLVCRLLLEKKKHISTKTTPLLRLRIVLYTP